MMSYATLKTSSRTKRDNVETYATTRKANKTCKKWGGVLDLLLSTSSLGQL